MERRIEADVEGWPTRPFEDGYEGLRQLASADFSGVVRADGTWLFFVNGKIVGVFEGDLEAVEDAQGTAHKAPHPSLPLLYAMQVTGGDTRAKYYTNDTPISEVHDTLSSGSFTGYVELSENVLSGDYYQLYHGGASMSVAFVGNSGKMITGEDAFDRADDEVGIYEVVDVDVDVTEVPQPESSESAEPSGSSDGPETSESSTTSEPSGSSNVAAVGATDAEDDASERTDDTDDEAAETEDEDAANSADSDGAATTDAATSASESDEPADASSARGTTDSSQSSPSEATPAPPADDEDAADAPSAEPMPEADPADEATKPAGADASPARGAANDSAAERSSRDRADRERTTASRDDTPSTGAGTADSSASGGSAMDGAGSHSAEADAEPSSNAAGRSPSTPADDGPVAGRDPERSESAWREATTVPSLDPDHTDEPEPTASARSAGSKESGTPGQQPGAQSAQQRRTGQQQSSSAQQSRSAPQQRSQQGRTASTRSGDVDDTLEQEVLEREDRIDRLQQRVENLEDDRDEVAEERDRLSERVESLTEENESLRGEIRSLEAEIEELEDAAESAGSGDPSGGQSAPSNASAGGPMTPRAALEGTDLFVRYDSKSAPTLEAAHDGSADANEVNQNLRLDVHTQFEDDGVTVDGEPFEAFLQDTMAYRFVEWLVRTLPYEIRETGSASELRDLYDALPEVDRVEFHGEVARDSVEGEEGAPSETFDVVVRDKMGEALFVANMNDARDPATGRMIVDLQEAAGRVKEHSMALSSAFFVTRSFFEPAALETASEATSGSLLSRDSRKSFVKLSRKQGYHLCLVEARGDDLHLNVPEL